MQYVNHLEGASLRIMIDVSVLGIHVQEKHFETSESFDPKACDFEFVLVAHDFLKDVSASSFIEKVFPLAAHSRSVFLSKEIEKDILLVLTNTLAHKGLEKGWNVFELEISILRVCDDELNKADKAVDVAFVSDFVAKQSYVFYALCFFDLFLCYLSLCNLLLVFRRITN